MSRVACYSMIAVLITAGVTLGQSQKRAVSPAPRAITVLSEPNAAVWIDGVFFGSTDSNGRFVIRMLPAGNRMLRVRLDGYKEARKPLGAAKGEISAPLSRTTDEAEIAYQQAEILKTSDRQKAIAAYQNAVKFRPRYSEALLGLARAYAESGDFERADKTLRDLKKIRPGYAEVSAVEGRLHKDLNDEKRAIAAFKRSIIEGGGYQPEAYTGLGLLYKEKAENAGSAGDFEEERANFAESARYLAISAKQLAVAPDASVVYQLLGLVYERQQKFEEAIKVYREFLKLFPDSNDVTAIESFILQLQKQLAEQP